MKTTDCQELIELVPAYSIGATDEDETRRLEAGMADCPQVLAELALYREAETRLLTSVPQIAPPPELLGSVLSAARRNRPTQRRNPRLWWYAAAACLALFIAVNNGYWLWRLNQAEQNSISGKVLNIPAAANGVQTGAIAQVVWAPGSDDCLLLVSHFPAQADGSFQAWVTVNGKITSLGTFDVNEQGSGTLVFPWDYLRGGYDALGVTLEPTGGSPQPTSPPVVRVQVKKT